MISYSWRESVEYAQTRIGPEPFVTEDSRVGRLSVPAHRHLEDNYFPQWQLALGRMSLSELVDADFDLRIMDFTPLLPSAEIGRCTGRLVDAGIVVIDGRPSGVPLFGEGQGTEWSFDYGLCRETGSCQCTGQIEVVNLILTPEER
jgi:hypothetical protein